MGRLRCCHQNAARQRAVAQLLRDVVGDLIRHETTRGGQKGPGDWLVLWLFYGI